MKQLILPILIFFFSYNKVSSQDFTLEISGQSGEWVFSIIPTNSNNVPVVGDIMTDMTFSVTFPTASGVTVNTTTSSSLISKSGAITPNPGLSGNSIQQFAVKPGPDGIGMPLPTSMEYLTPYEIGRITFTTTNAMTGDQAEIAPQGQVANNQPNIGINLTDQITNISGFVPLPITIKTFSATKDGERSSRLDWTSSSEINSDFIGIERSTDGEDWTTVGYVKAAGNSNRDIDYIYYRSLPMARSIDNIFYYRLRLTDLDGQYKYSETRGVNMGRLEGLVSIYPNPATDIINVDLTDMDLHEGIIHLSVYDNTGKAIISKEVNGAGIEPIQASNMAAGSYQVVVKQGDTTHRKQIIVVN